LIGLPLPDSRVRFPLSFEMSLIPERAPELNVRVDWFDPPLSFLHVAVRVT
jgi:hypothetical protein